MASTSSKDAPKGNKVALTTFNKWAFKDAFGIKKEIIDGVEYVVFVWCLVCAKNQSAIKGHVKCTGSAKVGMLRFINGTNYVSHHTLNRHIGGDAHSIALEREKSRPIDEQEKVSKDAAVPAQTSIVSVMTKNSKTMYEKMFRTADELALHPTMPLSHFEVLISCQRKNGIKLVNGKDDIKSAREYIQYLAEAVRAKVKTLLKEKPFFSLLTDGSQVKKTKNEKELVMARTEKDGESAYVYLTLADMERFGGANADATKEAVDQLFLEEFGFERDEYINKMIAATSDGASVNFGAYRGFLTQLANEREWLLKVHCVNHRLELAIKDSMKTNNLMTETDRLYQVIYGLLQNSGPIKTEVKNACDALDITHYELPKVNQTRFVGHREEGYSKLLHLLPALIVGLENSKTRNLANDTKSKVNSIVNRLKSMKTIFFICGSLDLLENVKALSKLFESESLLPSDVMFLIYQTKEELNEFIGEFEEQEVPIESHLRCFNVQFDETTKLAVFEREYYRKSHELRDIKNRETHTVTFDGITGRKTSRQNIVETITEAGQSIINAIDNRFESFKESIFQAFKIFDPKNWDTQNKRYGIEELFVILEHFSIPLNYIGFDLTSIKKEWKNLKFLVRKHFSGFAAASIWKHVLTYRRKEFPNLCKVFEIVISISGSNSSVERSLSVLTAIMTKKRLRLKHDLINDLMTIKCNHRIWSESEYERIISEACSSYLRKRRKRKADDSTNSTTQSSNESFINIIDGSESDSDSETSEDEDKDDGTSSNYSEENDSTESQSDSNCSEVSDEDGSDEANTSSNNDD